MRLPPYVIRRRQGLYLRLRLPPDMVFILGRTHIVRTLRVSEPATARLRAAIVAGAILRGIDAARCEMARTFMGVEIEKLSRDDVARMSADRAGTLAAFNQLSQQDQAAVTRRLKSFLARAEADVDLERQTNSYLQLVVDAHGDARQQGIINGFERAIAAGQSARRRVQPEAQEPWPNFLTRFYKSRPDLSGSTKVSCEQAFREWRGIIGAKSLCEIEPRDVARYAEWLESKKNRRGEAGILNRKTVVRLLGHVRTFTAWAKGTGLIDADPGTEILVRTPTKAEKRAADEGAKRAFKLEELKKLFESPLFVGCYSDHYRRRAGPYVFRDSRWWIFVVALLTGARIEELAAAPAVLEPLGDVLCLNLRHASKTLSAPRLVPVIPDLEKLGFIEMAARQHALDRSLFEDEAASADWSKWCNRYIDSAIGESADVSFHSFRHSFRQACSAAGLQDYLADKLLGHRSQAGSSEGKNYGRQLSPDEALLVVQRLRSPINLDRLAQT